MKQPTEEISWLVERDGVRRGVGPNRRHCLDGGEHRPAARPTRPESGDDRERRAAGPVAKERKAYGQEGEVVELGDGEDSRQDHLEG